MRLVYSFLAVLTLSMCAAEYSLEEVRKMPLKQLRQSLKEIGLDCKGCSEKDDYAQMYFANQHLPKTAVVEPESDREIKREEFDMDKLKKGNGLSESEREVQELMDRLKKGGFGGAKMYTRDDVEQMHNDLKKEKSKPKKNKTAKKTSPREEKQEKPQPDNIEL